VNATNPKTSNVMARPPLIHQSGSKPLMSTTRSSRADGRADDFIRGSVALGLIWRLRSR
jgi:hypothetical protein